MSFKKEFILGDTWDEDTSSRLEIFLNRLAKLALRVAVGTYTGDGLPSKTILVPEMGNPPYLVVIQNDAGVHTFAIAPRAPNGILAWNQKGFTLGIGWNANGKVYDYAVVS